MPRSVVSFSAPLMAAGVALLGLPAAAWSAEKIRPMANCATLGPDFVTGALGRCVRVEERLRVDRNARRDMSPWDAPPAFAPLAPGDGAMPAHLRLNGDFGGGQHGTPSR